MVSPQFMSFGRAMRLILKLKVEHLFYFLVMLISNLRAPANKAKNRKFVLKMTIFKVKKNLQGKTNLKKLNTQLFNKKNYICLLIANILIMVFSISLFFLGKYFFVFIYKC